MRDLWHEQQVCEKFLKHLVRLYVFDSDVDKVLKSHKLITLIFRMERAVGISLNVNRDMLRFLSDFYFDGRHPGVDFIVADREGAERGYKTVMQVKEQVDYVLENYRPETKEMELFE
ncbi:hypothetical protein D7V86_00015 [bacterium D16-51]|nr:hypothetical protein D7V96_04780 [bacterium D16-59]RKI62631.1 hypothetical protein D7V86_00015 [bacterium D16-51]